MPNYVEHPEVGRVYLVKRYKAGVASKRQQPAKIISISKMPLGGLDVIEILWLYDQAKEAKHPYYGMFSELPLTWLNREHKRISAELDELKASIGMVELLTLQHHQGKV